MIKIYTKSEFLTKENRNLFFPLLDEMIFVENSIVYNNYCFVDKIEDCDVLILPLAINYFLEKGNHKIVDFFKNQSKKHQKKLWVYSSGDLGLTLKIENVFVFRMADFKSKNNRSTVIMPVFIDDPYKTIYDKKTISYQSKTEKPIVGYVGHAKGGFVKLITSILVFLKENFDIFRKKIVSDYCKFYLSSQVRLKYLKIIQNSKKVVSNFIFRDKYRAGVKNQAQKIKTTQEFFDNIKDSQYVFCMRGGGNFSVRLYETLAMGRIPLFVNTDCMLPLSKIVDWSNYCVIVDDSEIYQINQKLLDFHSSKNVQQLISFQEKNRLFWEEYLKRAKYFGHIHDLFLDEKL